MARDTVDRKLCPESLWHTPTQGRTRTTEVHLSLKGKSFTIITSSISDYWESFAPAANHNSNRRISSDFCSLKRIILCIHYSRGGLWNLQQTKKSKTLSYAFLTNVRTDRLSQPQYKMQAPSTAAVEKWNHPFPREWLMSQHCRNNARDLWIIVGFPSFYPQKLYIWWSWLAFTQL